MSTLEKKKRRVLERLAESKEEAIFDKIQELLDGSEASYTVPAEYYDLLEEEHQKYLKGELKTSSWDEVEERLKRKYGL